MGRFVHCAKGRSLPTLLTPVYLGLEGDVIHHEGGGNAPKDDVPRGKAGAAAPGPLAEAVDSPPSGKAPLMVGAPQDGKRRQLPNTLSCTAMGSMTREGGRAGSVIAQAGPAGADRNVAHAQAGPGADHHVVHAQRLHLFQVLAPSLVARGRFFGSTLALKEEWEQLDAPYFSAPGETRDAPGLPCLPGCCASAFAWQGLLSAYRVVYHHVKPKPLSGQAPETLNPVPARHPLPRSGRGHDHHGLVRHRGREAVRIRALERGQRGSR